VKPAGFSAATEFSDDRPLRRARSPDRFTNELLVSTAQDLTSSYLSSQKIIYLRESKKLV
jgi:hypothetical protein